jgi:hypothetical protein
MLKNHGLRIVYFSHPKPQRTNMHGEGNKSLLIIEIKGVVEASLFKRETFHSTMYGSGCRTLIPLPLSN